MRTLLITSLAALALAATDSAQTPAAQPPPQPAGAVQPPAPAPVPVPASGQAKPGAPSPPAETYSYQAGGRRDPFLNLVGSGTDVRSTPRRGEGPSGMSVAEITVRGVLQSRGSLVAMIQGPDNKTYIVRQGDKFLDGTIKTVTLQGLIITQEVNDPLSLVKQREIRKLLRSVEDPKE